MCSSSHLRQYFMHFLLPKTGVHCRTQLVFGVLIQQLAQQHARINDKNEQSLQTVDENLDVELHHGIW